MILPFFSFQNIKIKLNTRTCMALKSSVVIFQALKPLRPQLPLQPQQPPWPQWPLQPHFIKKILLLMVGYLLATKSPILVFFLWNGSSRTQIFTDICTFSVGGCWVQLILNFWKLVDETQSQIIKYVSIWDTLSLNGTVCKFKIKVFWPSYKDLNFIRIFSPFILKVQNQIDINVHATIAIVGRFFFHSTVICSHLHLEWRPEQAVQGNNVCCFASLICFMPKVILNKSLGQLLFHFLFEK